MTRTGYKIMFGLIKEIFIVLLSSIISASDHIKWEPLSNQKCLVQPTLINLHPNECSQEFHYYPFAVKLDRCLGRCNTVNDLSNKVCVPNKTEDLNLSVFNMITGINESETLIRHVSCEFKCRFDDKKCNSDQWWNNDKCCCECKKRHLCEKGYVWNPTTFSCENGKYLANIMDDSAVIFNEIIYAAVKSYDEETKPFSTNFNEKKATCKT